MRKIILFFSIILIAFNNVFGFSQLNEDIENKSYIYKEYKVFESEEETFLGYVKNDLYVDKDKYVIDSYNKEELDENIKIEVIEERQENFYSNKEDIIKSTFGEEKYYDNGVYIGILKIDEINIENIDNGYHEELWKIEEEFSGYDLNELDNIPKQIEKDGVIYYLIHVDFEVENSIYIDGEKVPVTYKGIKLYESVVDVKNPYTYNITVRYQGETKMIDTLYSYKINYIYEQPTSYTKEIIICGLGISLIIVLILLNNNVKVYNKSYKKWKLILRKKITKNKLVIDITKKDYKSKSNIYKLKLSKSAFKKLKGKFINIKLNEIQKKIKIESREIEFIL